MGKIFYIMGKSATGKDTIFKEVLKREELNLTRVVLYTTRPIRVKESEGIEYHFVTDDQLQGLRQAGKVIELRSYHTVHGIWNYATVDDGQFDCADSHYLAIGTLESYEKLREYFGVEKVIPIYIEVSDDERLERALRREKKQEVPKFEEMCRRFLADTRDFSEENIRRAGIERRFINDEDREICIQEVSEYILGMCSDNSYKLFKNTR